jgi:hypothetical protein
MFLRGGGYVFGGVILYRLQKNYALAVEESAKASEMQNHPDFARTMRESFAKGGWQALARLCLVHVISLLLSRKQRRSTKSHEPGFAALED